MEKRLTAFLFRDTLEKYFESKTQMALELGMNKRDFFRVFRNLDTAKGGTIAVEKLLWYCAKSGIDLLPPIHCVCGAGGRIIQAHPSRQGSVYQEGQCSR